MSEYERKSLGWFVRDLWLYGCMFGILDCPSVEKRTFSNESDKMSMCVCVCVCSSPVSSYEDWEMLCQRCGWDTLHHRKWFTFPLYVPRLIRIVASYVHLRMASNTLECFAPFPRIYRNRTVLSLTSPYLDFDICLCAYNCVHGEVEEST